jgi:site-specific DNA-methyltransferase (adenine-specific)
VWEIPSERATRVGHPAPFPVELPQRLIELFTYGGDLVLDPFMGSGSTAVAAVRTGRHFVGYDTDEGYVAAARQRVDEERGRLRRADPAVGPRGDGRQAREVARLLLEHCGFVHVTGERRLQGGVTVDLTAHDQLGDAWHFQVCGAFTTVPAGLRRAETLWTAIGRAVVARSVDPKVPLVLLTTDEPPPRSEGAAALDAVRPDVVFDVVPIGEPDSASHDRLRRYAGGGAGGQAFLP